MITIDDCARKQQQLKHLTPNQRIVEWCYYLEGSDYLVSPIVDDEKALLLLDGFDCVTFVETALALSYSERLEQTADLIRRIRYRDGVISWENRNHFISIDWIPRNWSFFRLPTKINKKKIIWIDRKAFYDSNGYTLPQDLFEKEFVTYPFLNYDEISKIEDGVYLFNVISDKGWLMVDHIGFLFADGYPKFCHASSAKGKVVIQEALDFFKGRDLLLAIFRIR